MHERSRETAEIHALALELEDAGHSAIALGNDKTVFGLIGVADRIRDDAAHAIAALRRTGLERIEMLTGDNEETARAVAEQTGVSNYRAECLPEDKLRSIEKLREECGAVAMVGDGINDAPALTQSNLGIAIGSGTDIAMEAGNIVLTNSDPLKIISAINLSKKTFKTIKQNLFFAFFYNIIAIPLAAIGLLSPMIAAAAMSFSSVSVITNSIRIKKIKL